MKDSFDIRIYINGVRSLFSKGEERTTRLKKNIAGSLGLKVINIMISLLVVPLTINYINPERYGIWLTLSSIIAWLGYFDLGLGHGFRNRFAEAKAIGDNQLARSYVSTTYALLILLFSVVFIITSIVNSFIDWSDILKVDVNLKSELSIVFQILIFFFCVKIICGTLNMMLVADQRPAFSEIIKSMGQAIALFIIFILTRTTEGNLTYLAIAFSGIPCVIYIIWTFIVFSKSKYNIFSPSLSSVNFKLTPSILNLGVKFFLIMMFMLVIFQFINIIISRNLGPLAVSQYNIAYKYFNVIYMFANIIIMPFWSAFTDAYVKGDYSWMKACQRKLELCWFLCIPVAICMIVCSRYIFAIWIGDSVCIPMSLSISMALYILSMTLGNVYMYLINGIGKVKIQLLTYAFFAIVALPVLSFTCKQLGLVGIVLLPAFVYFVQAMICRIQLNKLISQTAKGIWNQ